MGYIGYDSHEDKSIPLMELNDLVVTQYTGFKDCSGKELYEEDIILYDTTDIGGEKIIGEVSWTDDLTLSPMIGYGLWVVPYKGWMPLGLGHYTILGNIFENPELLKGD